MRSATLVLALLLCGCVSSPSPPSTSTTSSPATTTSTTPVPTPPTTTTLPTNATPTCIRPSPTATCGGAPGPGSGPGGRPPSGGPLPDCQGSGPIQFNNSPMRSEDFAYMLPYGMLAGGHVTPIDHMYFEPTDRSLGRDKYEVRAIADGTIYTLQPRDAVNETGQLKGREWHIRFAHTCTFESYFDLLTSLAPDIWATYNASGGLPPGGIPVKAGQLIGRIGAQTLDFGVYDYNVTLPGFLVPEHYSEVWKVHTVDPFPYFPADIRELFLSRMMRQAEPRAGKIDNDVDGRLVGNWFTVGSGGYGFGDNYWAGHFAFVPDALDPTHWLVSLGNWSGQPMQFAAKGNAPDPRNVSVETGLVKVELVGWSWTARNAPERSGLGGPHPLLPGDDIVATNSQFASGTVLLQMMGPRLLKLETFPGRAAADVGGFDDGARVYER